MFCREPVSHIAQFTVYKVVSFYSVTELKFYHTYAMQENSEDECAQSTGNHKNDTIIISIIIFIF